MCRRALFLFKPERLISKSDQEVSDDAYFGFRSFAFASDTLSLGDGLIEDEQFDITLVSLSKPEKYRFRDVSGAIGAATQSKTCFDRRLLTG